MSVARPDPMDIHVGSRVRMRRLQLGMSQEKLAVALGLTFQQVQKYEKGTNRIGSSRLSVIARALEVNPGFFFEQLPGADLEYTETDSAMDRFMASREGLMIARAFVCIPNPQLRAAIARFVRDAGGKITAVADAVPEDESIP